MPIDDYNPMQAPLFPQTERYLQTHNQTAISSATLIAESRARLQYAGPTALSQVELLSLILSGDAGAIWQQYQSLAAIDQAPWRELTYLTGIGEVAACRLKAAVELGRRLVQEDRDDQVQITNPATAAELLMMEMRDLEQEHLRVVMLDTKNHVIGNDLIYIGNVNTSIVRTSEVLRPAIRINAPAVILAHNHPSGDPSPSPEDIEMTKKIIRAGQTLDIEVLDHLVIGHNKFTSLRETGEAFK